MWRRQVDEQDTRWTTMEKWFDSWQGRRFIFTAKRPDQFSLAFNG